ncbi:Membrane bound FAD containing D-sorbitol dehydrogenase [Symmachiella dynata]|uniref:Membrane bound FAD containing D-sorbitol dehydrogenase n=1 Tax=Symmachiella dynata TaxID=2527995 RepID=A0A517ZK72_9PLAN|nr:hypothetical protein [Symmachiella dynata]QDU42868.1 Membrane bound FAD containing D-sorbitol dehydrogenase [Symmachiella dynata]
MPTLSLLLQQFIDLSVVLTGFDETELLLTGVGQEYFDTLVRGAGQTNADGLLIAAQSAGPNEQAIERAIWDDDRFGPMARSIVIMWYVGNWHPLSVDWHAAFAPPSHSPLEGHVISANAYREGLVWPNMGTHPRGVKPAGFGMWRAAPEMPVIE